jgi:hypothetical protein
MYDLYLEFQKLISADKQMLLIYMGGISIRVKYSSLIYERAYVLSHCTQYWTIIVCTFLRYQQIIALCSPGCFTDFVMDYCN